MELKNIDLNLLVVFNQLCLSAASRKLLLRFGLSQPAVSNAPRSPGAS